jgi:hypothetical protein
MDDTTLENMDQKARSLLYEGGLDEDAVEGAMMRLHLVLRDAVGDESPSASVESLLRGVVDAEAIDDGHLHAHAAQAAARELIASWRDVILEGSEEDSAHRHLTGMMVTDIDEVIAILRQWKACLSQQCAITAHVPARRGLEGGSR